MGPEYNVVKPEHLVADSKLLLTGQFSVSIGILRNWNNVLSHGGLASAVDCDRRRENQAVNPIVNAGIDYIDGTDQVAFVVESLDEMTQPLRRIRRKMVDILK